MASKKIPPIRRIAINTGGGDAPGLNAVIRAATLSALRRGWEVYGIRRGYGSFLGGEPLVKLTNERVRGIAHLGGTILGSTNKGNPFEIHVKLPRARKKRLAAEIVVEELKKHKIDGLLAVGGDGSLRIAHKFHQMGLNVIGVPKTIDNDLCGTLCTFGFDTAVQTATEAIDKLHSTAQAHDRIMVVEVMGRYSGWIALHSGLASSSDAILIPEIPFEIDSVCRHLKKRAAGGRPYGIVCVAEGAAPKGHGMIYKNKNVKGREPILGGIGKWVAEQITRRTKLETRSLVLGHLQRGGSPTTYDRLLALRFGAAAVRLAAAGLWGHMVSYQPPAMGSVPLEDAIRDTKKVTVDCDTVLTGRDLGICFGD
ncbi:MAG: ATP-dependent 6-phosphofructokinase [Planctomycetes bacterium]|nr:ATP-dependent 6-phosphofructokinase [Planctomycetota bacterium]